MQKYSGAGNKFIMIENLDSSHKDYKNEVLNLISNDNDTDGVIFLEKSGIADFRMNYFNKDGSGNSLCGNGLRCTMRFIIDNKISDRDCLKLEAVSNIYECNILVDGQISVSFPPPEEIKTDISLKVHFENWWEELKCSYVNNGSPHIVVFIDEIEKPKIQSLEEVKIIEWGRNIRLHKDLMPHGANVNFVRTVNGKLEIRSYERGVEGETLACGTGAMAAAVISYLKRNYSPVIKVLTRSGEYLIVEIIFEKEKLSCIKLTGNANRI